MDGIEITIHDVPEHLTANAIGDMLRAMRPARIWVDCAAGGVLVLEVLRERYGLAALPLPKPRPREVEARPKYDRATLVRLREEEPTKWAGMSWSQQEAGLHDLVDVSTEALLCALGERGHYVRLGQ